LLIQINPDLKSQLLNVQIDKLHGKLRDVFEKLLVDYNLVQRSELRNGLVKPSKNNISNAWKSLDASIILESGMRNKLRMKISEVFAELPNPTVKSRRALGNRLGLRSEFRKESSKVQMVGISPDLGKLPDLVDTVAHNIGGQNRIIVFAGGKIAQGEIFHYLSGRSELRGLLEKGEIIITDRINASQILHGGIKNAELIAFGLPSDTRFAERLRSELRGQVDVTPRIATLEQLETDLFGVSGYLEAARSELRSQWMQTIAA